MTAHLGITILVCCYNSEKRIKATLEHISKLKADNIIPEIILVNNASTDDTSVVATELWNALGCDYDFKIIDQPVPGLMAAREKGMETARYDHILFCDDDNWLNEDYLLHARNVILTYPDVAVIGGKAIGEYETEPEHWFLGCTGALAIGPQADNSKIVNKPVYGAGCVINKLKYRSLEKAGFQSLLSGRKGKALVSGEDTELCHAFLTAGYNIHYEEKMWFRHFMPASRMNKKYIKNLCLSGVHSSVVPAMYENRKESFEDFRKRMRKRYMSYFPYFIPRIVAGNYKFTAYLSVLCAFKVLKILNDKLLKDQFNTVHKNLLILSRQK